MDISALSMTMSVSNLGANVGFAMMSKVLDSVEDNAEAMIESIEAMSPDLGQIIDIRA